MSGLCLRCGHVADIHRRPGWLWALLGRWACTHRYRLRGHGFVECSIGCQCDGWKSAAS